jgi:hypothetical protein
MNNTASSLLKLVALLSGAVLGTLLTRLLDKVITERAEQQSEHDRTHYARGLAPISPKQQ